VISAGGMGQLPPHKRNALPRGALHALQRGEGDICTTGQMDWGRGGRTNQVKGVLQVFTSIDSAPMGELHVQTNREQQGEPRFTLILAEVSIVRWCVNGKHGAQPRQSHAHHYLLTGHETHHPIPDLTTLPFAPTVEQADYRSALQAFAAYAHIDLQRGYWADLPEGW
jgi:hypothetical protein